MRLCTIRPSTPREEQIAHSLGTDAWQLLEERPAVICFGGTRGALVRKHGHTRWVRRWEVTNHGDMLSRA